MLEGVKSYYCPITQPCQLPSRRNVRRTPGSFMSPSIVLNTLRPHTKRRSRNQPRHTVRSVQPPPLPDPPAHSKSGMPNHDSHSRSFLWIGRALTQAGKTLIHIATSCIYTRHNNTHQHTPHQHRYKYSPTPTPSVDSCLDPDIPIFKIG